MDNKASNPPQLQIEVSNDLTATYTNFAIINHSYNEIVIDFAHIIPNVPVTRVRTRVVLTPYHARLLLDALATNLANYEKHFGEIKTKGLGIPEMPRMGVDPTQVH